LVLAALFATASAGGPLQGDLPHGYEPTAETNAQPNNAAAHALRMKLKEARQHLRALHHFKPYHKEMKTIHQDFKKYKKSHKDGVHLACYESVVMP